MNEPDNRPGTGCVRAVLIAFAFWVAVGLIVWLLGPIFGWWTW